MSEPTREHIEAVARTIADDWNPDRDPILTAMFSDYADTILTSTDPAVLDAMQDALVRAGRLTEVTTWQEMALDEAWLMRRLATEWTEVTP